MRFAVKHPEIERKHPEDEGDEDQPGPDHAGCLEIREKGEWKIHILVYSGFRNLGRGLTGR
jgi:hypothetical protein